MSKLTNNPPKGTADWLPDEFSVRKYIFDTWRKTCVKFGYEEYLTPIVESAEVYRAKSGEDIGGKELMTMVDQAGRELAIRPEMTPSVTRMVTKIYHSEPKPIRLFSVANFLRNEKPQRGRNREFWQLNFDIFGSESINADIEILQMAVEIMLAFNSPVNSFQVNINNRKLIDYILTKVANVEVSAQSNVVRVLDKWDKFSKVDLVARLSELALEKAQVEILEKFMNSNSTEDLKNNFEGIENEVSYLETASILEELKVRGYEDYVVFKPNIIRGFDYYDGMVFEVFDNHPDNNRSMFGGGRYNGLASIFGQDSFPAVGCAPGDETTKLFLESWNLIPENLMPETIFIPIIDSRYEKEVQAIAKKLRSEGQGVEVGLEEQRFGKALAYADSKKFKKVILLGENEMKDGVYMLKDMVSGEEQKLKITS